MIEYEKMKGSRTRLYFLKAGEITAKTTMEMTDTKRTSSTFRDNGGITMNEATVLMWYDNSVLMTFLGVFVGAVIGFVGSVIQGHMAAKNNIDVVNAQAKNEIEQHRYMEKEKLYSELIGFIPQFTLAIDIPTNKINLSREQRVQLNSFKARLAIFANQQIYDEFYELIVFVGKETDEKKVIDRMDIFTEMLLEDLKQPLQTKKGKDEKGGGEKARHDQV